MVFLSFFLYYKIYFKYLLSSGKWNAVSISTPALLRYAVRPAEGGQHEFLNLFLIQASQGFQSFENKYVADKSLPFLSSMSLPAQSCLPCSICPIMSAMTCLSYPVFPILSAMSCLSFPVCHPVWHALYALIYCKVLSAMSCLPYFVWSCLVLVCLPVLSAMSCLPYPVWSCPVWSCLILVCLPVLSCQLVWTNILSFSHFWLCCIASLKK